MEFNAMDFLVKILVLVITINFSLTEDVDNLVNIARGKPTNQSGTYDGLIPSLAVDGNREGRCAHPHTYDENYASDKRGEPAWWLVDLSPENSPPTYYIVRNVTIYQRSDCCYDRTAPLSIRTGNVTDVKNHTECGRIMEPATRDDFVSKVKCAPEYPARFLSIVHDYETSLGFCEVEVFGFEFGGATPQCDDGKFGDNCQFTCFCKENAVCNKRTGSCPDGCDFFHAGMDCQKNKPYIPGSLVVMSISHNSIDLKFNVSVPPADGYLIEHWTEGVNITNIALKPPTLPETHLNVNLGDLEPSRNYTVRVSPYVEDGPFFGIPSIQIFRTKPIPTTPSSITSSTTTTTPTTTTTITPTSTTTTTTLSTTKSVSVSTAETTTPLSDTTKSSPPGPVNPSKIVPTEEITTSTDEMVATTSESGGMIAAIVIAVLLVIIIAAIIIFILIRRKKNGKNNWPLAYPIRIPDFIQRIKKKRDDPPSIGLHESVVVVDREEYEQPTPAASPSTMKRQIEAGNHASPQSQRPAIKLSELPQYIQNRKQKTDGFKDEYKILPNGPTAAWLVGNKPENKTKNRFLNIRAYDHSRVVLSTINDDIHSDYINADYISGYGGKEKAYIAAQGPKKSTMNDMWRMIWESNTNRIVMVTNLVEGGKMKCEKYWPDRDTEAYGNVEVTVLNQDAYSAYVIRTLNVTCGEESRTIRQFHFTGWPDHGVPLVATDLLEFRRRIRAFDNGSLGPILIHCSAGVGRTGTFIAVDYCLDQAEVEKEINVWGITNQMRFERVNMIQTLEQYIFVYDALYEAILSGDTLVDASRFKERYSGLCKEDPNTGKSLLDHQLEVLESLKNTKQDEKLVGLQEDNIKKNRFKEIVPNNRFRPFLSTQIEDTTSYINAVYVDSFLKKHAFIATQMPMPKTVVDFWRLVHDHQSTCIVMLNEIDTKDSTSTVYWPASKEESMQFGSIEISLDDENTEHEGLTKRKFIIQNHKVKRPPTTVTQFQLTCWPKGTDRPTDTNVLFETISLIEKWQQQNGNASPITFHDTNGASRCGVLIALIYVLEQLKVDQQVDVFRCVKQIRVPRHQFIVDKGQFKFLHEMVIEYMNTFSDYSNFN